MKSKLLFCLFCFCILFSINTAKAYSPSYGIRIALFGNENPNFPIVPDKGHRSITEVTSVSAFLSDTHTIELNFNQPIGEVEILISQDGETVYASSQDVTTPISKDILLPHDISGSFLLEIKGESGVWIYGLFVIK